MTAIPPAPRLSPRLLATLTLLLMLAACGGGPTPTTTPAALGTPPTATTMIPVTATAATTVPVMPPTLVAPTTRAGAAAGVTPPATTPAASAAVAPPPGGTPSSAAATAMRGTPTPAGTAVPTATLPRGYAPGDPCASFADGAVPPLRGAAPALPAHLCIPAIGVSAPVIPVGIKGDGAMDEPGDLMTVGWYAPGPPPGAPGNAAIDGKVNGQDGGQDAHGIFWDLGLLAPGDLIVVVDTAGVARRFRILGTQVYRREDAPVNNVFGPAPDANLNLITGAGTWDPVRQILDSNLIIFARLAP